MKSNKARLLIVLIITLLFGSFFYYGGTDYLTCQYLGSQKGQFAELYTHKPFLILTVYFLIYVIATSLSLPGATILTLAGGALFGLTTGLIVVSFASSIGATLAFLVSRFLLRDSIQEKFGDKLKAINKGIEKEGAFYLFTLRLIPIFPFFVINLVMGLTPMKTLPFYFVSQLGMLAGTAVYVNAGTQIGELVTKPNCLEGILSPGLLFSFILLGLFPLISKKIINYVKQRKVLKPYRKPKKYDYNVIAIGAGAGGLVTSYISAALKAKVALIEKHKMGGDCLNTGCVPSKALIRSAKMLAYSKRAEEFGFKSATIDYDFADVMERVQRVVKKVEPHDSVERYTNLGVDCIQGEAKIKSPYEVEVNGKILTTKSIVVATGARPFIPPLPGLDKINFLTSDNIWNIRKRPEKLLVLGGGPIGCELAQSFQRLGCQVTLLERSPRIMAREDLDVSEAIQKKFEQEGLTILTSHDAKEFKVVGDRKILIAEHNGQDKEIEFDEIILAIGRKANVTGFGLEDLGVQLTDQGTIEVDDFLRTNFPNIFVCGDVAGPYQFTHTAAHQAYYATVNALFKPFSGLIPPPFDKSFRVDYSVIPWATYTDPEVATVGLTETTAKEKGTPYELTTFGIDHLDRAIADEEDYGFVKVLTKPGTDKVIGATIVGYHASDLIIEFIAAMKHGFGLNSIMGTIHIYPTMAEANKYLAGNWKKARKPEGILAKLEKFHSWRRG